MAFWAAEVKPGEPLVLEPSAARLRVTMATLGNYNHTGWTMLECKTGRENMKVGMLNPEVAAVCQLELEFKEGNAVLSVFGNSSVHFSGYYVLSHNCEHGLNNEWETHGKDIGYDYENKDGIPGSSCNENRVLEKPSGTEDCEDCSDDRPDFTHGGNMHKEMMELNMPKLGDLLYDQNNATDRVEKTYSKTVECNGMDGEPSVGHPITLEGNVLQTTIPDQSARQTQDNNDDHIIKQSASPITTSCGKYICTGAAENNVKEQDEGNVLQTTSPDQSAQQTQDNNDGHIIKQSGSPITCTSAAENIVGEAEHSENIQAGVHINDTQTFENGLKIQDLIEGNSDAKIASNGKEVRVRYRGCLENDEVVDPTGHEKDTYTFVLGAREVIEGWELGIHGMRVGGKRRLSIPPALGYGENGRGNIPPNAWLFYDITLLKVKRGKKEAQAS